jgi:hypothetical protein
MMLVVVHDAELAEYLRRRTDAKVMVVKNLRQMRILQLHNGPVKVDPRWWDYSKSELLKEMKNFLEKR